jgi:hypothetical protein
MYYYSSRDRAVDPESDDDRLLGQSGGDEANPNGDAWKVAGRLGLQLMQIGYQVLALAFSLHCWHISFSAPVCHACCRTKRV